MTQHHFDWLPTICWASLVAQMVKNLPAVWETWIRSLGQEDPLASRIFLEFKNHSRITRSVNEPYKKMNSPLQISTAQETYNVRPHMQF